MSSPLRIRLLTAADLPFADAVRALAGWNQTLHDWERFLGAEPEGCFLAEWEGAPAGTATTTVYQSALAWIGMVLVHPDYRRRGVGGALLRHCIRHLHDRGVPCIKLDATPEGQPVYEALGFKAEWALNRWVGSVQLHVGAPAERGLRSWRPSDLPEALTLDAKAFGVARLRLIETLVSRSLDVQVATTSAGSLRGFGFLRSGSRALYVGPVIAESESAGLEIVEGLLERARGHDVYWDIPDGHTALVRWTEARGWVRQRPLTRMVLGRNATPGNRRQQIALSGPETG